MKAFLTGLWFGFSLGVTLLAATYAIDELRGDQ